MEIFWFGRRPSTAHHDKAANEADIRDALLRHHSRSFVQVVNYGTSWPEGDYPR
jgi:hypothetical protein